MAVPEIVQKLDSFLKEADLFTHECEAVYFMVEVRKVIEQQNLSLPVLKFYTDWCVHSEKDKITPEIKAMAEQMYSGAVTRIKDPNSPEDHTLAVNDFVYMVNLRSETASFLSQFGLPDDLTQKDEYWKRFIAVLVKVLENQPINDPSGDVQTILFEPAATGCVIGTIIFKQPVEGYPSYSLKNVY